MNKITVIRGNKYFVIFLIIKENEATWLIPFINLTTLPFSECFTKFTVHRTTSSHPGMYLANLDQEI